MTELDELMTALDGWPKSDIARVKDACAWAAAMHEGKLRASGEPAVTHPLRVARILADMGLDADSVAAGALHHAFEEGGSARDAMAARSGEAVANLVEETTRIAALKAKNKTIQAAETIRKMLFAMTRDIRVIIVKLADKLDNMRTLKWLPDLERKRIATECVDIFAPLADRLGISWMKDELEDLALKELNREAYDQIKRIVAEKKGERDLFLSRVERDIVDAASKDGIGVELSSRAKHFYSIYLKMRKRAKGVEELFDLLGVRLICGTENDCYALLGIVHKLWKPIEGRFKDYVAMPKANGYRSLHTTVMCYDGRLLEIQIRTREMHRVAEFGVASHWLYKKGSTAEHVRPEDIGIVNKLKDWSGMLSNGAEFLDEIKRELLKDSIFVFTPRGDVLELPAGATPLDFAYLVHTDIGNRCYAAKADGVIVPLSSELRNTQLVEIITSNSARPNVNWLRSVRTSGARAKIRQWLVANGQALVIERNVVARRKQDEAGHQAERHHGDKKKEMPERAEPAKAAPGEVHRYVPKGETSGERAGIFIEGGGGLVIRFAGCCRPATGDPIVGYVSRGRGIIVHRRDCPNLPAITEFAERAIDVAWESRRGDCTRKFRIEANRTFDLFSEIEGAVKKMGGVLAEGRLDDSGVRVIGYFTLEMEKAEDARRVERNIRAIPSILRVQAIR
ncbi:MAG: RelA/SpoT family protein [Spirochaetes bacterium]|nr:RelA/SpoT family protein [Spirochaetota bacterium]